MQRLTGSLLCAVAVATACGGSGDDTAATGARAAVSSACSVAASSLNQPVVAPGPEVPADIAAFSGVWRAQRTADGWGELAVYTVAKRFADEGYRAGVLYLTILHLPSGPDAESRSVGLDVVDGPALTGRRTSDNARYTLTLAQDRTTIAAVHEHPDGIVRLTLHRCTIT